MYILNITRLMLNKIDESYILYIIREFHDPINYLINFQFLFLPFLNYYKNSSIILLIFITF